MRLKLYKILFWVMRKLDPYNGSRDIHSLANSKNPYDAWSPPEVIGYYERDLDSSTKLLEKSEKELQHLRWITNTLSHHGRDYNKWATQYPKHLKYEDANKKLKEYFNTNPYEDTNT